MKYLILWLYLFSYTIGFANLAICLVAWLQSREKAVLNFLIIFSAYTVYDLVLNIGFFLNSVLDSQVLEGNFSYFFLYSLIDSVLLIVGTHFTYFFVAKPLAGLRRLVFYSLSSIPLLLLGIELIGNFQAKVPAGQMAWFLQADYVLTLGMVYFAVFRLFLSRKKISQAFFGPSMLRGLIIGFVMIPIGLIQVYWNFHQDNPLRPLSVENVYYFVCNAISAVVFARYYLIKPYRRAAPLDISASYQILESDESMRQFRRVYGITDREAEIIGCIRLGLTNKQMAERLFIAPITVKNHIYNIYYKTQVSTRVELINLLMSINVQAIDSN